KTENRIEEGGDNAHQQSAGHRLRKIEIPENFVLAAEPAPQSENEDRDVECREAFEMHLSGSAKERFIVAACGCQAGWRTQPGAKLPSLVSMVRFRSCGAVSTPRRKSARA